MKKPKYVPPRAELLDRTMAVSIGGCSTGVTPGTCGIPGYAAGTCAPTGDGEGGTGAECTIPGLGAGLECSTGNFAGGGCSTGNRANK